MKKIELKLFLDLNLLEEKVRFLKKILSLY
jgi:hypothetical protein